MAKGKARQSSAFILALKGAFLGAAVSLVLILAYAFIMYKGWLMPETAPIATPAIKIVSAALSGLLASGGVHGKKLMWAAVSGLMYSLAAFMLFSIISTTFVLTWAVLTDMAMCAAAAAVAALIRGMLK